MAQMEPLTSSGLPVSVAFVKNEAGKIHPAFRSNVVEWDRIDDRMVSQECYRPNPALIEAKDNDLQDLREAIKEYEAAQRAKGESGTPLNLGNYTDCTWDHIFAQLDEAQVRRDDSQKGGLGILRKMWRKLGERADKIDPWLEFIPDEHGLGFLRTGLLVALILAKRSAENQKAIVAKTVVIIDAVSTAQDRRKNIPWDTDLANMVKTLYVCVLEAVALIIQFLMQKVERSKLTVNSLKLGSRGTRGPDGSPSTRRLPKLSLEDVDARVSKVTDRTSKLINAYKLKMDGTMITTQGQLISMAQSTNRYVVQGNNRLMALESTTEQNNRSWKKFERSIMNKLEMVVEQNAELFNLLRDILKMQAHPAIHLQEKKNKQLRSHSPSPGISVMDLMCCMSLPSFLAQKDLDSLLETNELFSMDDEATQAVETLIRQPALCRWLDPRGSNALLINGNDEKRANDSVSAMTLVCVNIIGSLKLREDPRTAVLYFFCGQHTREQDGPRVLVESLIEQLLLVMHKARFVPSLPYSLNYKALGEGNMNALIELFERLLRSLPREVTVYCIIDGVAWYEIDYYGFTRSMIDFTRKLSELAWPQEQAHHHNVPGVNSMRCSFKVMLASANGTQYIRRTLGYAYHCVDVSMGDWEMGKGSF